MCSSALNYNKSRILKTKKEVVYILNTAALAVNRLLVEIADCDRVLRALLHAYNMQTAAQNVKRQQRHIPLCENIALKTLDRVDKIALCA